MTNERIKRERIGFVAFVKKLGYIVYNGADANYAIGHRNRMVNSYEHQELLRLFNSKIGKLIK